MHGLRAQGFKQALPSSEFESYARGFSIRELRVEGLMLICWLVEPFGKAHSGRFRFLVEGLSASLILTDGSDCLAANP